MKQLDFQFERDVYDEGQNRIFEAYNSGKSFEMNTNIINASDEYYCYKIEYLGQNIFHVYLTNLSSR